MTQPPSVLQRVVDAIAADPHSAISLTLYALISTLEYEQAGCLFKLNKLRDLDEAHRRLAYEVMELMVAGGNRGEAWDAAKASMDELVRSA